MKVVIDNKIPFIQGVFEPFGEVIYADGKSVNSEMVKDADAIVTRTRTMCNRQLLEHSQVKYIATATIGYDHIDSDYCTQHDITWCNAPGCNANAVVQYVFSALAHLAQRDKFSLQDKTLGIVGVGNVGSRIAAFAEKLGIKVLLNDPPREDVEGKGDFVSLAEIQAKADIITFHTPLNKGGVHPTFHLCDAAFIDNIKVDTIIINASRGEVCSSDALNTAIEDNKLGGCVIDCWENEPDLDLKLLEKVDIATFHIAGYSLEGKANATTASVRAISRFFDLGLDDWKVALPEKEFAFTDSILPIEEVKLSYPIMEDDALLRKGSGDFEQLRGNYKFRREPDVIL